MSARKPNRVTAEEFFGRKPSRKALQKWVPLPKKAHGKTAAPKPEAKAGSARPARKARPKPEARPEPNTANPADLTYSGKVPPGYRVGLVPARPNWWPWRAHPRKPAGQRRRLTPAQARCKAYRQARLWAAVQYAAAGGICLLLVAVVYVGVLAYAGTRAPEAKPTTYQHRPQAAAPVTPTPGPCPCCREIVAAIRTREPARPAATDVQVLPPPPPVAPVPTTVTPPVAPAVAAASQPTIRQQCQAIATSTGRQCRKLARPGETLCSIHARLAE